MSLWLRHGQVCVVVGGRVHAADGWQNLRSKRKTYDTACGRRGKPIGFPVVGQPGDGMVAPWPPYVADVRDWGYERCRECMTRQPGKPERLDLVTP